MQKHLFVRLESFVLQLWKNLMDGQKHMMGRWIDGQDRWMDKMFG